MWLALRSLEFINADFVNQISYVAVKKLLDFTDMTG